jgi:hypothetical protein
VGSLYVTGGAVLGTTLLLAVVAGLVHRSARHQLGGLATGVAVFVALVGYGSVLGQVGVASAHDASVPGPWIGGGIVLGLLTGYAVARPGGCGWMPPLRRGCPGSGRFPWRVSHW